MDIMMHSKRRATATIAFFFCILPANFSWIRAHFGLCLTRFHAASINTQNVKRDNHLKSADFFDVENHPKITFASTSVKSKGSQLNVKGNLSMHGKTKSVTIPFKVAKGKNGAGVDTTTYKGKLTIDRNDWGIGSDSIAAKISLEDEVEIKLLIVTFQ